MSTFETATATAKHGDKVTMFGNVYTYYVHKGRKMLSRQVGNETVVTTNKKSKFTGLVIKEYTFKVEYIFDYGFKLECTYLHYGEGSVKITTDSGLTYPSEWKLYDKMK